MICKTLCRILKIDQCESLKKARKKNTGKKEVTSGDPDVYAFPAYM
jgi:hypothetical protein